MTLWCIACDEQHGETSHGKWHGAHGLDKWASAWKLLGGVRNKNGSMHEMRDMHNVKVASEVGRIWSFAKWALHELGALRMARQVGLRASLHG